MPPAGRPTPPVPGSCGSVAIEKVGLPLVPSPPVTVIWPLVPVRVAVLTVPLFGRHRKPEPLSPAKEEGRPVNARSGLPDTPLPLVTLNPLPLTVIERAVTALEAVLAIKPVPAASSEPEAAFSVIWRAACAPPSTSPTPVPADRRRLLASVGS